MSAYSTMARSAAGLSTQLGEDWRTRSACADDPERQYPTQRLADVEAAKRVCVICPVITECLEWATDTGEPYGVWGGVTEEERRRMRNTGRQPIHCERCDLPFVPRVDEQIRCTLCRPRAAKPTETASPSVGAISTRAADHHDTIAKLLTSTPRPTYANVAKRVGCTVESVKHYWLRYQKRLARQAAGEVTPSYHDDVLDRWAEHRDAGLGRDEVAKRIGVEPRLLNIVLGQARKAGDSRATAVAA